MSKVYKYDGLKFIWKAGVFAHAIENSPQCMYCSGQGSNYDMWDGIVQCGYCSGTGKKPWCEPMIHWQQIYHDIEPYMQECLDKYFEEKEKVKEQAFLGMYL